jgi:type IV secretion system protein TrbE
MTALHSKKQYRTSEAGVSDLLNWATYPASGVVMNKSGSLLCGWFVQAPDGANATPADLNYLTYQLSTGLNRLDSRCAIWFDAVKMPTDDYPAAHRSQFPDPILNLIENERAAHFKTKGAFFETRLFLVLSYTPPLISDSRIEKLMYAEEREPDALGDKILATLEKIRSNLEDSLSAVMKLKRMGAYTYTDTFNRKHLRDELINYLHSSLTGLHHPINIPPVAMFLAGLVGGQELWVGNTPKLGDNYIVCIGIEGFPFESFPNMLTFLDSLPVAFRWSTRVLFLEQHETIGELGRFRRKWRQKARGFFSQVFKTSGGQVNEDAMLMAAQTDAAINEAQSDLVRFGYYTPVITLMGSNDAELLENARLIIREINHQGFAARLETLNTMEAWLGSLPGHEEPNIRRSLIHATNQSDLLPTSSPWLGERTCPSPLFPKDSPPLLYAEAAGNTRFCLNLHVEDVGHTLVFGPTGGGKSTLLALLIAQFLRYPSASVFAFDKGKSLWALANAAGGLHYDIATEHGSNFTPLQFLEDQSQVVWATEWVSTCFQLQVGRPPTPSQREAIHKAITLFQENAEPAYRSLSDFLSTVQDTEVRQALSYYTVDGALGHLLDSPTDGLQQSRFTVLEIEELMAMGEKIAIPVLLYLFRRFERSLKGQPALLVLDEAWVMLGHPVFREKIREWLKVLRKSNCAVVMATQSLSDAVKSGIFDVLVESCPTRILLPNEEADKGGTDQHMGPRDLYTIMGLNDTEIQILKTAIKKRQYYYSSPNGKRLFDLALGPVALSFVGVSDKKTLRYLRELKGEYGRQWPYEWLNQRDISYEHLL